MEQCLKVLGAMPKKTRKLPPIDLGDEELGERIARLRRDRGLTQVELAEKIGIIQPVLSDYERGRLRLYAEMVARFGVALDVSADELLGLKSRRRDRSRDDPETRRIWKIFQLVAGLPEKDRRAVVRLVHSLVSAKELKSPSAKKAG
jgi:transcriptional regulator with XRE-family HTH domain